MGMEHERGAPEPFSPFFFPALHFRDAIRSLPSFFMLQRNGKTEGGSSRRFLRFGNFHERSRGVVTTRYSQHRLRNRYTTLPSLKLSTTQNLNNPENLIF